MGRSAAALRHTPGRIIALQCTHQLGTHTQCAFRAPYTICRLRPPCLKEGHKLLTAPPCRRRRRYHLLNSVLPIILCAFLGFLIYFVDVTDLASRLQVCAGC